MATFSKLAALAAGELGLKERYTLTKVCILDNMSNVNKSHCKKTPDTFYKMLVGESSLTVKMGDYGTLRGMLTITGFQPIYLNVYMETEDGFVNDIDVDDDYVVDKNHLAICLYERSNGDKHFSVFITKEPIENIDDIVNKLNK